MLATPSALILHRRIENGHHLAGRLVLGPVAFLRRNHDVLQADVRERAARHHQVIAAAGAVLVEVLRLHAAFLQELASRRIRGDVTGGRDVVGGDGVAEHAKHARILDLLMDGVSSVRVWK
jgi:hypothetical protein